MRGRKRSAGWARLGWVMLDGSLPHGPLDAVDPLLTQLRYLPSIDTRDRVPSSFGETPSQYWLEH